jgi:hypothetical protein
MNHLWLFFFSFLLPLITASGTLAQTQVNIQKPTNLSANGGIRAPDSTQVRSTKPKSLTFSASTDQRFFFFEDTRNDNGRRVPVSVYGIRAGFLFPTKRQYEPGANGRLSKRAWVSTS